MKTNDPFLKYYTKRGSAVPRDKQPKLIRTYLERLRVDPSKFKAVFHVIGSTGKGATSIILASVLQLAGFRVALYTKPHLKTFLERLNINGVYPSYSQVRDTVTQLARLDLPYLDYPQRAFITALKIFYNQRNKFDVLVVEAGIGAKNDYTNVFTDVPIYYNIITSINPDHTLKLGTDLQSIIDEKTALVKYTTRSFILPQTSTNFEQLSYPKKLEKVIPYKTIRRSILGTIIYRKEGKYFTNIVSLPLVRVLGGVIDILGKLGIKSPVTLPLYIPARTQLWTINHCPVVLDTAHNKYQFRNLKKSLKLAPRRVYFATLGKPRNKAVLELWGEKAEIVTIPREFKEQKEYVPEGSVPSVTLKKLLKRFQHSGCKKISPVLFTGSVYFIGEIFNLFNLPSNPLISKNREAQITHQKSFARHYFKDLVLTYKNRKDEDRKIVKLLQKSLSLTRPKKIGIFIPLSLEPDITSFTRELLRDSDLRVFVPVKHKAGWKVGEIKPHALPLNNPLKIPKETISSVYKNFRGAKFSCCDIILVPGLAFDQYGHRLGHGGGVYDRLLHGLKYRSVFVFQLSRYLAEDSFDKLLEQTGPLVIWVGYKPQLVPFIADLDLLSTEA